MLVPKCCFKEGWQLLCCSVKSSVRSQSFLHGLAELLKVNAELYSQVKIYTQAEASVLAEAM